MCCLPPFLIDRASKWDSTDNAPSDSHPARTNAVSSGGQFPNKTSVGWAWVKLTETKTLRVHREL